MRHQGWGAGAGESQVGWGARVHLSGAMPPVQWVGGRTGIAQMLAHSRASSSSPAGEGGSRGGQRNARRQKLG